MLQVLHGQGHPFSQVPHPLILFFHLPFLFHFGARLVYLPHLGVLFLNLPLLLAFVGTMFTVGVAAMN